MNCYPLIKRQVEAGFASASAPAKINLWLEVLKRRTDGFHEVETLMAPITLFDRLNVRVEGDRDSLEVLGDGAPSNDENLVMQALQLARQSRSIPSLAIQLTKNIPSRAGLGGGSSDAAAMLVLLDELFEAPGGRDELKRQAALLGSDVCFFLGSGSAFATGRGEQLHDAPQPFLGGDQAHFILWVPEIGVDTTAAYASLSEHLTSGDSHRNFRECDFMEKSVWVGSLHNRLLDGVRRIEPALHEVANFLDRWHPGRWTMTGSGSCFIIAAPDQGVAKEEVQLLRSRLEEFSADLKATGSAARMVLEAQLWSPASS
ncbi:MAG: 4-(cytidine 5'-diphospho)-2-C-methyl-D-erythritol kinase [Planctomycetota bacterium]|nr:4-(cytidine 5'-diphospho)-2-C-methyl-D-erythritol kinase [Planctomycetota bacterium]